MSLSRREFDDLKERIGAKADDIARRLLPGAVQRNGSWSGLNPRRSDRHAGSFIVYGAGHKKRGSFIDYAAGESGDALDLVAYLKGFPYRDRTISLRETLDWLGELTAPKSEAERQAELDRARRDTARWDQERAQKAEQARNRAMALWRDCRALAGTQVQTYLEVARGIPLDRLPHPPGALRFHPGLANWMEPRGPGGKHPEFPAMVAAMSRIGQPIAALQRTFLTPDGGAKAAVRKAKLIYPDSQGAVIRIGKGVNLCSPEQAAADGLCGETLVICEGAEDALSCMVAMPDARVWACCGVTNIRFVDPGPTVSTVIVAADNDWLGSKAREALEDGLFSLRLRGFDVRVAFPDEGKDFNDMLKGAGADGTPRQD